MKFVNIKCQNSKEELLSTIKDSEKTNRGVIFDKKLGTPIMRVVENGDTVKIKCELNNRATRDDGFMEGTYFRGKIKALDDGCEIKGVIVTAPIWHSILAILFLVFVCVCIFSGGFSPVPIILIAFDLVMFYTEFKKQGIIKRYLDRAVRITEKANKH